MKTDLQNLKLIQKKNIPKFFITLLQNTAIGWLTTGNLFAISTIKDCFPSNYKSPYKENAYLNQIVDFVKTWSC